MLEYTIVRFRSQKVQFPIDLLYTIAQPRAVPHNVIHKGIITPATGLQY